MKKIILLGATGSIGLQCIDVVTAHSCDYEIVAMACGVNIKILEDIIAFSPCKIFNVKEQEDCEYLSKKYPHLKFTCGDDGLLKLLDLEADVVVNALVGFLGLKPSLVAIEKGKNLALANKESLVVGGELVKAAIKKHNVKLYPIDSEHSAIFQCLQGNDIKDVKRLVISASGGSFRDKSRDELVHVNVEDALRHPNWSMGKRITIDSATMMNKGFEVIEAYYLFDIDFDNISVIINKESVLHSMVEYIDKSFIAQLGTADMRIPIQYALSYPQRLRLRSNDELDLAAIGTLNFQPMDYQRYPLLKLAFDAGRKGGNSGAIINAADEIAVALFLERKIKFLDIEKLIFKAYEMIEFIQSPTLDDLIETDKQTRELVYNLVEE